MSNYYYPEYEEFRLGFKYEFKRFEDDEWHPETFKKKDCLINITRVETRVKYLDEDDLKELDMMWDDVASQWVVPKSGLKLCTHPNHVVHIFYMSNNTLQTVFFGIIRNKYELKEILSMIQSA
jgi:hypothetical protein